MNRLLLTSIACALGWSGYAQQSGSLTNKDYQQEENFLGYNTQKLIDHGPIYPSWLPGDRFWYRTLTPKGSEFILVDPAKGSRVAAFDHQMLAASLSSATGKTYSADLLPFQYISFSPDGSSI